MASPYWPLAPGDLHVVRRDAGRGAAHAAPLRRCRRSTLRALLRGGDSRRARRRSTSSRRTTPTARCCSRRAARAHRRRRARARPLGLLRRGVRRHASSTASTSRSPRCPACATARSCCTRCRRATRSPGCRVGFVVGAGARWSPSGRACRRTARFNVSVVDAARGAGRARRRRFPASREGDVPRRARSRAGARWRRPPGEGPPSPKARRICSSTSRPAFAAMGPSAPAPRPLIALLERAVDRGVLLAPGDAFGAGYDTCARLCTTAVRHRRASSLGIERLLDALDAMRRSGEALSRTRSANRVVYIRSGLPPRVRWTVRRRRRCAGGRRPRASSRGSRPRSR